MPENITVPKEFKPKAFFYSETGDTFKELTSKRRVFSSPGAEPENAASRARTVFLRHGDYRLRVISGPFVYIKTLHVNGSPIPVDLDFTEMTDRLVSFHVSAVDSETMEDISSKVSFELESEEGRKKLGGQRAVSLKSGGVFDAYVTCAGYEDEHFVVEIDFYQNDVFISAEMRKAVKKEE